jgi:YVTN family beta-propeller protein
MNFSTQTSNQPTYLELFATGLNGTPTVTIGGVSAQVASSGPAGWAAGLEQINVIVPSSVAGAGRVPVVITANGQASNTVQIVVLPPAAQSEFPGDQDNHARARELAALAYIPGTSSVLSTDENDDVVRVIDVSAKKMTHVIALPQGAAPVGVAVNAAGTIAVVAESGRGMAAILNLSTFSVTAEVTVGAGPTAVAISGSRAVVVNQDADSVTVFNLTSPTPATVGVGRGPAGVAVDAAGNAYVTNEDDGTVSVIALSATPSVTKTITLGASSLRPEAIAVNAGTAYITVPAAGPDGMVIVLNLATGVTTTISANPDRSGGSSDVAISASNVYFANQTGGSVSVLPLNSTTIASVKVDLGARAMAIDTNDNLLVVSNEGTGTLVLVSLSSNTVTGRINAVQTSPGDQNDHGDHNNATNLPVIVSMTPTSAKGGATFTLTITGTNLTGATAVNFGGNGNGNRGSDFTVSKISVNSTGTQLTATVSLDASAKPGARIVSVTTPNGDSTNKGVGAAVFAVTP